MFKKFHFSLHFFRMTRTLLTRNLKQRFSRLSEEGSSSWSQKHRRTSKTPRTKTVMIKIVITCSDEIGIFSISISASRTRSFFGLNWKVGKHKNWKVERKKIFGFVVTSKACLKCRMLSWMFPYFLKISPSVKYCRHADVAALWTSKDLSEKSKISLKLRIFTLRWNFSREFPIFLTFSSNKSHLPSTRGETTAAPGSKSLQSLSD